MPTPVEEQTRARRIAGQLGLMTAVAAVLGVLAAGLAMPVVALVGAGANDVAETMEDLPVDLEATALAQKTNVLDVNGKLIASFYDENRVNVTLDQISKPMVQAIVAIEDYRFYEHGALDLKGTLRALITNQAADGNVQGGSSITQQMVKLTLVDMAGDDVEARREATRSTYERKIRELRYAIAVEQNYTKDWILERYLNIAYFGDGAYGVQAAARHYFDKNASKLTVKEAATLAGLVKNPVGYDPTTYPDRAKSRRNVVLNRMAELNVITRQEAAELQEKKLGLKVQKAANGCVNSRAAFFCDYVYRYLLEDPALGKTREERKDLIRSGGLTIRTTVNMKFQKAADKAVSGRVNPTDQAIGALAMVEPRTGNVRAVAQSRPMGDRKKKGETYLNYVVPEKYGDSAGFQGGSTFKAFVMAAALQDNVVSPQKYYSSPAQIVLSERDFKTCDGSPYGTGVWDPKNSTSSGTMNMYTGTRLSVNTYYAQLTRDVGICAPFKMAKKMGIQLDNPYGDENGQGAEMVPSFGLGIANTSPLELAEAYATFGARGIHCDARPVTAIEDSAGNVLKEYPKKCKRVMRAEAADTANDILRGVTEPGGFGAALALPQQSAGKTGTTQSNRAVWFSGYTPDLAAAAMIAGANSLGHPISLTGQTIGGRYLYSASGSGNAGPIWGDAMKAIAGELKGTPFTAPTSGRYVPAAPSVPSTSSSRPRSGNDDRDDARPERRGGGREERGGRGGRGGRGNGGGNGNGRSSR